MNNSSSPEFNLIDDPWIVALTVNGEQKTYSLRTVFAEATTIKRISGEIATQNFSILRLLVAIAWRSYTRSGDLPGYTDEFRDEEDWWRAQFNKQDLHLKVIDGYFSTVHERFWLIHPEKPFYQVANLATENDSSSEVSRMVADAESTYFTSRSGPELDSLSLAEAARWLLHVQSYDYSGIKPAAIGDPRTKGGKGYPIGTGAAGVGGGVIIHGENLAETLWLNLPAHKLEETSDEINQGKDLDLPAWELPPHTAAPRHVDSLIPNGSLDALTWQSRRVKLYQENGRIVRVLITNGDKLELRNNKTDPFFSKQFSKNLSKKDLPIKLPKKHYSDRTFWRGVESLMYRHTAMPEHTRLKEPHELPDNIVGLASQRDWNLQSTVNIELVGNEYGPQDSIITNCINTEIPMHLRLLTSYGDDYAPVIIQNVSKTLSAASTLGSFSGMLTAASGGDYQYDADAVSTVLVELEAKFREWLFHLDSVQESDSTVKDWRPTARKIILKHADDLVTAAGPQALIGRIVLSGSPGKEPKPQLHSAGTARIWLLTELKKYFPKHDPLEKAD